MADISAQPIPELGNLMTAFPRAQSEMALQGAQAQLAGANTGLARAQTGLVGVQTQKAAFEVQMIRDALQAMKNISPAQSEQSGESNNDPTETGIASSLNKKFYVDPMGPPGVQQYINATAWVNPAEAQRAEEMRKLMVSAQTTKNQNEANDIFQTSSTLFSQSPKHPLQALLGLRPGSYLNNVGRAIASDTGMSDSDKDQAATTAIQSAAKYSHQYTGRGTEIVGDEVRDPITKQPVFAPKAGLTAEGKQKKAEFQATPQTVTQGNAPATVYPNLNNPTSPRNPTNPGGTPPYPPQGQIPGLSKDQSDFVNSQPAGFNSPPGNQQINPIQKEKFDTYNAQRKDLAKATNLEFARAKDQITQIQRIKTLLNAPDLTLGPGSHSFSQLETFFNQWLGTSAGQAGAYQVLSKVLNASEMNDLLQQFHSEGAQVRLGAYESRLIMEKLAANPNLTKEAIQQMLEWQASDAAYTVDKAKTAGAVMASNKSVENFDKNYGDKFPKQDLVDTTLKVLHPQEIDYSKVKGKTYTKEEVSRVAASRGIPLVMFQDQLQKNGATIK